MYDVLALILGGGRGARLFPLTLTRSKPAVPISGKYRLIDVPISNCLHGDIRRICVLTQFNSASLNRHVTEAYRMDFFSRGFVEILAAEQTPDNPNWFQGTADALRQAARHFVHYEADYYLVLPGDQLYRMDFGELVETHVDRNADITIAANPVSATEATALKVVEFDRGGQVVNIEDKPDAARLQAMGSSIPYGSAFAGLSPERPFVASMGVYLFSRDVLLETLAESQAVDLVHEVIPASLKTRKVAAHLFRGYWADVGTVASFYDVHMHLTEPAPPFTFYDPLRPIFTRPQLLPGCRFRGCRLEQTIVTEGCVLDRCTVEHSVVGLRSSIGAGAHISRSVLLGADFYETDVDAPVFDGGPPVGIGREVVLDRVIVDKNARIGDGVRLVNEAGVQEADGEGYYIRNGIIIVPKGGVVKEGTVV